MEIHIQKCQKCDSANLRNIIYRESGEPDRVYAQCNDCDEFVASYVIAPLGYYHHGKGYESFLRGVLRSGEFMSGRKIKDLFLRRRNSEESAFLEALKNVKEKGTKKNGKIDGSS
ncbi:MAG: hypothetical protein P1U56_21060 [Saprospiraceae bacterium]|nr:hypothetical protein [Saprospiraceae bacterium]